MSEKTERPTLFVRSDGSKFYYLLGRLHNPDGPAIEHLDGSKFYYLHGLRLTAAEFMARTQCNKWCLCEGSILR